MGEGQGVLVQAVVRAEKPAAAAGLDRVHGIARHGVVRLGQKRLVVGEHQPLQSGACLDGRMHVVKGNPGDAAGDLHHVASEGFAADKGAQQTEQPLASEHRHLGDTAIRHDIDEGHDGVMREVGVADRIARLVQHGATRQDHGLEVWFKKGKVVGVERGEKPVGPVVQ